MIVLHLGRSAPLILSLTRFDDRKISDQPGNVRKSGFGEERWRQRLSGRRALLNGPGNRA
jgi:hypothetical protein